ncbi:Pycsar system effector family protein [Roseisalinus antarcticus]|uniref:Pycsar effector protein domain-containing protein n=1 Tax=Roseisalinus antarcticus TaxID=254357 RepID=A0A1Y5TRJ0_9RHOB|nr:Pycsar system effector family protein [Roseisalinus antarcticus]SLN70294.1 hypothetical protein ROA7023_03446 [Roseisalinus antarcticus]
MDAVTNASDLAPLQRAEIMEKNLARMTEAVRAADLKMALLVPTTSAMVGVLAALFRTSPFTAATGIAFHISLVPLVAVFVFVAVSVVPRLRPAEGSMLFFGTVAQQDVRAFRARAEALDAAAYLADLADQCHAVASIARLKHRIVRRAYITFLVALPLWAVAVYVLSSGEA